MIKRTIITSQLCHKIALTSGFRCPRWFLLTGWFIAIVVLLLPPSSSDRAKQHPAGLEESNQERLFGLRPIPPNDSSRLYVDTSSFQKREVNKSLEIQFKKNGIFWHFTTALKVESSTFTKVKPWIFFEDLLVVNNNNTWTIKYTSPISVRSMKILDVSQRQTLWNVTEKLTSWLFLVLSVWEWKL